MKLRRTLQCKVYGWGTSSPLGGKRSGEFAGEEERSRSVTTIEISDELAAVLKRMAAADGLTLDAWFEQLAAENAEPETEEEERAKFEWLRAAAKEGVDAIERGEYTELNSPEELAAFIQQIGDEVEAEFAAERRIG